MNDTTPLKTIPKPSLLRWEISFALLIKILLLVALWFLIFRWQDRPVSKPDIAAHFLAYGELQKLRAGDRSDATKQRFAEHKADPGYGLLLKKYTDKVVDADSTIPCC